MRVMDATGLGRPGITRHGLFTDIRGPDDAPPLLFLHGGPGQGCYDFMALQGDRLARSVRVVGLDQRGVDRSAQLPETGGNPAVTIADLIADCEAARRALGIERWAVLGHSFGGNLALRYAVACPDAIEAVIFENPVWDMALSCRAALPPIAALLAAPGRDKQAEARTAREAASRETAPRALRAAYLAALEALGEDRENFFVPSAGTGSGCASSGRAARRQARRSGRPARRARCVIMRRSPAVTPSSSPCCRCRRSCAARRCSSPGRSTPSPARSSARRSAPPHPPAGQRASPGRVISCTRTSLTATPGP